MAKEILFNYFITIGESVKSIIKNYFEKRIKLFAILFAVALYTYYAILSINLPFISDDLIILFKMKNNFFPLGDWLNGVQGYFRPVTILAFFIMKNLFNTNAFFNYLINISLHFLNAYILFKILFSLYKQRFIKNEKVIYFITLVFLVLPHNQLNIFWISEINDIIATLLGLLTVYFWVKYNFENKKSKLLLSLLFFIVAFMTKETALLIIYYFIAIDFIYYINRYLSKKIISSHLLFFVIIALYFIFRIFNFGSVFTNRFSFDINLKSTFYSIWQMLLPIDILDLIAAYNIYGSIFIIYVSLMIIFVSLFVMFLVKGKKNNKIMILLYLLFLLFILLINSNFLLSSRILYILIPLSLMSLIFINFQKKKKNILLYALLIFYSILISIGQINSYVKIDIIKEYYNENISFIENNIEKLNSKKVLDLTSIERIGQFFVPIDKNRLFGLIKNNRFDDIKHAFINPIIYSISVFDKDYNKNLVYEYNDKLNILTISTLNDNTIIDYEKEKYDFPFTKVFLYNTDGVVVEECLIKHELRRKYCKKIKLRLNNKLLNEVLILFHKDGKLTLDNFSNFVKHIKESTDGNNMTTD